MTIEITMPALSPTMTEGTLAKWVKGVGDSVVAGEVIAEIETDKATMEVEAVDEGVIGKIVVEEGTEGVAVNSVIAVLFEDGETEVSNYEAPDASEVAAEAGEETGAPIETQDAHLETDNRDILYAQGVVIEPPAFDEESFSDTATLTVREALRDAMAEEMRGDKDVLSLIHI